MSVNFYDHNITTSGTITSPSGNFTTLIVNGTSVSNFNSSVSGLLPTIANSGDNRILTSTGSSVGINAESNLTFNGSTLGVVGGGSFSSQTVFASGTAAAPGISIVGDTDTGIGQLSANGTNSLSIMTSGVERVTVNSAGNVGIGTSSPSTKLDVFGTAGGGATIRINDGTQDLRLYTSIGIGVIGTISNSSLGFHTNNTEKMRITSDGNVGIGTSSPSFKLDVSGAGRIGNGVSQGNPGSTDIKSTAHTLLSGTGGNYLAFGQYGSGSNYAQWIQSSFDNPSTATYNLVLQPLGGNVGIGIATPTLNTNGTVLHIHNSTASRASMIRFTNNESGSTATDGLMVGKWSDGTNYVYDYDNYDLVLGAHNGNKVRIHSVGTSFYQSANGTPALGSKNFYAATFENLSAGYGLAIGGVNASTGSAFLQVQNFSTATAYDLLLQPLGGNVGIGTTSPGTKLQINGQTRVTDGTTNIDFVSSSAVGYIGTQTNHPLVLRTNDTERIRITTDGNVGIGTGSSIDTAYKLNVLGSIRSDASSTSVPSIIGIKDFTNQSTGDNISSATYGYATSNGSYAIRNLTVNTYFKINSGITNSGSSIGITNNNLRNYALTNDIGTLSALYGIYNQYGHYNTSVVSPTTTTAIGIQHILWRATGTITNAFDIYCSDASSGATVTNRWGIFVEHTGNNYFGGNLGIGVQPPSYRLHVVRSGTGIIGRFSDNATQTLDLGVTASAGAYLDNPNSGYIDNRIGGISKFKIGGDGSLTAPDVYGDPVGATNRDLFIDSTGLIGYVSSIRSSKIEINNLDDVSWLKHLVPVSYYYRKKNSEGNYTDEPDGNKDYGLIAEDVEVIAPELCFYDIINNIPQLRGVHYSKLITPMLKYIQQLEQELQNIRNRVSALEGE